MPPKRKPQQAATAPKRTTRSSTARDPSQEFIELPAPTRKRSTSSAASTTSGERDRARPLAHKVERKVSGKSLRRHFTIELPAQQAREAARTSEEDDDASAVPEGPRTPPAAGSSQQDADGSLDSANAAASPSRASPWGFASSILNMARRVLSPFPPSKKLQSLSAQSPTTPLPAITNGLSPITEESPSKMEETPTAARVSRKRKTSDPDQALFKRTRLTEETTPHLDRTSTPARRSQAPRTPTSRTPARRTSRSVREQRYTPAKFDQTLSVPYVPTSNTFTVPEDPGSPDDQAVSPIQAERVRPSREMDLTPTIQRTPVSTAPATATKATQTSDLPEPSRSKITDTTEVSEKAGTDDTTSEATKKRKRVKVDELSYIPSRRPGQSAGTFALLDEFFDYDEDSVEIDEILLEEVCDRPTKKARLERNVFDMVAPISVDPKTPTVPSKKSNPATPANAKDATKSRRRQASPEKSTAPESSSSKIVGKDASAKTALQVHADPSSLDASVSEGLSSGTGQQPDALSRKRSEAEKYKPTKGSRLREMQRLSSTSTLPGSPQSPITGDTSTMSEAFPLPSFTTSTAAVETPAPGPFSSTGQASRNFTQPLLSVREEEPTWEFPPGEPLTSLFTEDEISWANAHPPSQSEVDEALVKLRADYTDFVASGGLDMPIEQFLKVY